MCGKTKRREQSNHIKHLSKVGGNSYDGRVEISYGMEIQRMGNRAMCRWMEENIRRFVVEHVLLHEIGHHVQLYQRWKARQRRRLPSRTMEQFAEDYGIRFQRESGLRSQSGGLDGGQAELGHADGIRRNFTFSGS